MKFFSKRLIVTLSLAAFLAAPITTFATNGYFALGYGAKSRSMAGVAVALPLDTMVAAANPAGMLHLGNRWDAGLNFFNPNRSFTANDDAGPPPFPSIPPGEFDSSNDLFLIPYFGLNWMLDDKSSIGVSIGGNGGLNTEYQTAVFQNFNQPGSPPEFTASAPTGADLVQLFVGVTYAREVWEGQTLGVMPILAGQRFKAEGLEPFKGASVTPGDVTNRGHDYSFGGGVRVGWLGKFTDWLSVGASYQSQIYMTKFDKYSGLLAEGGDFDIPSVYNIGIAVKPHPKLTFGVEYQRINYEDVAAVSNSNGFSVTPNSLGGDNGLGFGWQDMDIVKLGLQWEFRDDLSFRVGYSTADQVIPSAQALFNILAPATIEEHVTFGFTKAFGKQNELNFTYVRALNEKVSGTNPNTGPQTGFLEMDQNAVEVSWSRKF